MEVGIVIAIVLLGWFLNASLKRLLNRDQEREVALQKQLVDGMAQSKAHIASLEQQKSQLPPTDPQEAQRRAIEWESSLRAAAEGLRGVAEQASFATNSYGLDFNYTVNRMPMTFNLAHDLVAARTAELDSAIAHAQLHMARLSHHVTTRKTSSTILEAISAEDEVEELREKVVVASNRLLSYQKSICEQVRASRDQHQN